MKLTDREKIVVLLAPLAIVLGGYGWWYNVFQRPKMQTAERDYEAAVAAQVKPLDMLEQQTRKKLLDRELDAIKKQKAQLDSLAATAAGHEADPVRRIEAEKQLGDLLRRHGLQLVEEGLAAQASQNKLPGSLAEAVGRFGKPTTARTAQVRRLRLSGTFMNVLAAVRELAALEAPPGVPISLSMSEADSQADYRTWTLLVLM